ncbi:MAG: metallophosphoesterase [Bryobacterales bacterium]|nr:metallophosphoesterase [Bryobacterales bacterium]
MLEAIRHSFALPRPFAVIADVHGNIWALEPVLADIRTRGITSIVNLGDHLSGALDPANTADLLMGLDIPSIRGNQDRDLRELKPEHAAWLTSLPALIEYPDFLLCHGTPESDETYLLEDPFRLRSMEQIARLLPTAHRLVLCGHSHTTRLVTLADGRMILNPGSVGLPAYTDDQPVPHAMEAGSPHARYAIVEEGRIEQVAVTYNWQAASEAARRNGRADWAHALLTGRALRRVAGTD